MVEQLGFEFQWRNATVYVEHETGTGLAHLYYRDPLEDGETGRQLRLPAWDRN